MKQSLKQLVSFRSDFYHNMLMAGEVEEVVVYPGAKAALIFLRPDAIYKVRNMLN